MKPKLSAIRAQNRTLRSRKHQLYVDVITRLLEVHRGFSFLGPFATAFRRRDWAQVVEAAGSLSSQKYDDATSHFVANQFALLVKKFPFEKKVLDLNPRQTAINSFFRSERRGARINRKFAILEKNPSRDKFDFELEKASTWVRSVLNTEPNYREIFAMCDFGPGANLGVHGDATHILRKMSVGQMTVSPGALHHAFAGICHNFHFLSRFVPKRDYSDGSSILCLDYEEAFTAYLSSIRVLEYNKIDFVLKNAKTHRSIGIETLLSGYVQKGTDLSMRKRLRKVGIDLAYQDLNQRLAREGSLLWESEDPFVTLDVREASNSVFTNVVKRFFSKAPAWFELFARIRSSSYEFENVVRRYELFVSMGNGFCFPLETTIFASLCHAVNAGKPGVDFMVYGDDIIVRRSVADRLIALLRHCGFRLNGEKSFLEGPFRESCGADWFNGEDVRPFTLDYELDSLESIFKFLNLSRRNERTSQFFLPIRDMLLKQIPKQFQFWRPFPGLPDSGIDSTGDEHLTASTCTFRGDKWEWYELVHKPKVDFKSIEECEDANLLASVMLRGAGVIPYGENTGAPEVTFRRKTRTKVTRESYASTSNWLPPPTACDR